MYTRIPSGRYPRGMRVPENYGGSAFRPLPNETEREEEPRQAPVPKIPDPIPAPNEPPPVPDAPTAEAPAAPTGLFSLGLPFLRRDNMGIGFEDLLLVGLIFLVAQEGKNDDLVWLLLLLLLIR